MTHNNCFYHHTTNPITTTGEITVKYVSIEMTIPNNRPVCYVPAPNPHKVSEHKGNKGLKDDQNVDQCSPEVPLREELKRETFEKRVKDKSQGPDGELPDTRSAGINTHSKLLKF